MPWYPITLRRAPMFLLSMIQRRNLKTMDTTFQTWIWTLQRNLQWIMLITISCWNWQIKRSEKSCWNRARMVTHMCWGHFCNRGQNHNSMPLSLQTQSLKAPHVTNTHRQNKFLLCSQKFCDSQQYNIITSGIYRLFPFIKW